MDENRDADRRTVYSKKEIFQHQRCVSDEELNQERKQLRPSILKRIVGNIGGGLVTIWNYVIKYNPFR